MYSKYQRNKALQLYDQCNSVSKVIHQLGYPTRKRLYEWIAERDAPPKSKAKRCKYNNTQNHPRHPSLKLKLDTIHRCFVLGENVQLVSEEIGYSRASIYIWHKKYILKGAVALMNTNYDPRGNLPEGIPASSPEVEQLKRQMQEMQMEIDILKGTLDALKKDPGVDLTALRNREKAVMIDALKDNYSLQLQKLKLLKSSYYYQRKRLACTDKYAELKNRIKELSNENGGRYGYRRIHALLAKEGTCVSEKIVRKLMSECEARVKVKRRNKYNSYKGEITPAVPNIIQRNFHADMPNQKWLTDITEFTIPAGKVYLSAIIDCFDGMLPAWNISSAPDASLVNNMLDRACCTLNKKEHPVIHSDRG